MTEFIDQLMNLWLDDLDYRADAAADFRRLYADPVMVNGLPLSAEDMVARARALQQTYRDLNVDVIKHLEVPGQVVVAFVMRGRQDGPLQTPIGIVRPTGRTVEIRVTDILTVVDGKVTDIWLISDDLAVLRQLDAVTLADPVTMVEPGGL